MIPTWIYEEPTTVDEYIEAAAIIFFLDFCLTTLVVALSLSGLLPAIPPVGMSVAPMDPIETILIAPPIEELIFRALPLWVVTNRARDESPIVVTVIVSSFVFGLVHGTAMHIAAQGIGGLMLSALYLKCGGLRGTFLVPFFMATVEHMAWNAMTVLLSRLA